LGGRRFCPAAPALFYHICLKNSAGNSALGGKIFKFSQNFRYIRGQGLFGALPRKAIARRAASGLWF
jgi:hypothetical protein